MVGDGGVMAGEPIVPNFMAAGGLAVKLKPKLLQPLHDFAVTKAGEPAHQALTISG